MPGEICDSPNDIKMLQNRDNRIIEGYIQLWIILQISVSVYYYQ